MMTKIDSVACSFGLDITFGHEDCTMFI